LFKSYRAIHEDRFSGQGATIASFIFAHDENDFDEGGLDEIWRVKRDGKTLGIAVVMLESALAGDRVAMQSASNDLLANLNASFDPKASAPYWIRRIKDDLTETNLACLDVAARAREAGVHAVHASRLFRRCFGLSITEHAMAQGVRRAIALLSVGAPRLSDVALAAGFYDQCHMNRVFRRVIGTTPGTYRALLRQAG
jgi:AraC-like DNA-binding protein